MRVREMKYEDYGLTQNQIHSAIKFCRCSEEDSEEELVVRCAAKESNTLIADALIESVRFQKSYTKLFMKYNILYYENDFYAYRRKFIANLYRMMCLLGYK